MPSSAQFGYVLAKPKQVQYQRGDGSFPARPMRENSTFPRTVGLCQRLLGVGSAHLMTLRCAKPHTGAPRGRWDSLFLRPYDIEDVDSALAHSLLR